MLDPNHSDSKAGTQAVPAKEKPEREHGTRPVGLSRLWAIIFAITAVLVAIYIFLMITKRMQPHDDRNAIAADKQSTQLALRIAHDKEQDGDILGAIEILDAQLRMSPDNADVLTLQARLLADTGRYDISITKFSRAIELTGNTTIDGAKAYMGRGNAYQASSEWDLAISDYSTVIQVVMQDALSRDVYAAILLKGALRQRIKCNLALNRTADAKSDQAQLDQIGAQ